MKLTTALLPLMALASLMTSASRARAEVPGSVEPEIAEPSPAPMAPVPRPEKRWYGWQTLTAVAVSDSLVVAGGFLALHGSFRVFDKTPVNVGETATGATMAIVGLTGHVFSGAVVHALNGQKDNIGYSIGLNLGVPLIAGLSGLGLGYAGDRRDGAAGGAMIGVIGGMVTASILDISLLSHAPRSTARVGRSTDAPSFAVAPVLAPGTAGLGVAGRF